MLDVMKAMIGLLINREKEPDYGEY